MSSLRVLAWLLLYISCFATYSQTIDPNFQIPTPIAAPDLGTIAIQPDGKVIISGNIAFYENQRVNQLVRLHPNGDLDDTFSFDEPTTWVGRTSLLSSGEIIVASSNKILKLSSSGQKLAETPIQGSISSISIQSDDKIVVTTTERINDEWTGRLYRYHANLTFDETFQNSHLFTGRIEDAALQGDKIIVLGEISAIDGLEKNDLIRFNADGSLDDSFDVGTGADRRISFVTVGPNQEIYLSKISANMFNGQPVYTGLLRLHADGTVDNSFFTQVSANSKPIFQDGKIIIGTHYTYQERQSNYILALNHDGTINADFEPVLCATFNPQSLAVDTQNNLYFNNAHWIANEFGLGKLTSSGHVDPAFQPALGKLGLIKTGDYHQGMLVVGGDFVTLGGVKTRNLAKLDETGRVDVNFQIKDSITLTAPSNRQPSQITILDKDTIMVALGDRLLRMNSYGQIDSTFIPNGVKAPFDPALDFYFVDRFEVLDNNKIVASSGNGVYLLNQDGSQDNSFSMPPTNAFGSAPIGIQSNGVIGEYVSYENEVFTTQIVRLGETGAIDPTFASATIPGNLMDISVLKEDSLLVTGRFNSYTGITTNHLVKLNGSGVVDEAFTSNFLQTSPAYNSIEHNRKFRNGYIVSGQYNYQPSVTFIRPNGVLNTDFSLPQEITQSVYPIYPIVVSPDTIFLFSLFHRSDQEEYSTILKLIFNDRPVIKGTTAELTTPQDTPLALSLTDLLIDEGNNAYSDTFTLSIQPGEHYVVEGDAIVPESGFAGTLLVPVTLNDGKYDSDPYTLAIKVIPNPITVSLKVDTLTSERADIVIIFSKEVQDFTLSDVVVAGATLENLNTSDSLRFETTLLGTSEKKASIMLPENMVQSITGTSNAASDTLHVIFPPPVASAYAITLKIEELPKVSPVTATLFSQQALGWQKDTTISSESSTILFEGLTEGRYTCALQVADTSYLGSYLGGFFTLSEAESVAINQDTTLSIPLLRRPQPLSTNTESSAIIEGVLLQGEHASGRVFLQSSLAQGTPIAQVAIYLFSTHNNQPIAYTRTDENGYFRFEGLPIGIYYLRADYESLVHETALDQIAIDDARQAIHLSILAENILRLESITLEEQALEEDQITSLNDELAMTVKIFPNPVTNELSVNTQMSWKGKQVSLSTSGGKLVRNEYMQTDTFKWNLSEVNSGIYILTISNGLTKHSFRVVKK